MSWALGADESWELGSGLWDLGSRSWALGAGFWTWALGQERDSGSWARGYRL